LRTRRYPLAGPRWYWWRARYASGGPFGAPWQFWANKSTTPRDTFYGLVDRDFRDTKSDIGTIDVKHEDAGRGAGRDPDIGIGPFTPPGLDLFGILGGVLDPVQSAWVFSGPRTFCSIRT